MLNSISWQEFMLTLALLIISYYFIATLVLYRLEIKNLLAGRKQPPTLASKPAAGHPLMGETKSTASRPANTVENVDAADVILADPPSPDNDVLLGAVSDLTAEIDTLVQALSQSGKDEAVQLFQALMSRYPQLSSTRYRQPITQHLYNACRHHCAFELSLAEIEAWWPAALD